ncbi:MAG: hypothetical protein CVV46_08275 [Spirochaetae bacterium HGW-Spirochaetae-2]|nr:MAG: hypothetical protein CVV46_08275 [Spirochaetae bacterium HGW-Spirochaetae-2]
MAFLNFNLTDSGNTELIDSFIQDVYTNHPNPASYEAKQSVHNVLSDAYPNFNRQEIENMAPHIIKAATGQDLDYQGAWSAIRGTFDQAKTQMHTSQDFFNVYAGAFLNGTFDSDSFANQKTAFFEQLASRKLPYRADHLDMSFLTDMAIASANLLPYTLDSMKFYTAGGAASALTGNAVPMVMAKAASGVNVAMKEAGAIGLELAQMEDEQKNRLDDELIWSVMTMVGIANGTLEVAFDAFPKGVAELVKNGASKVLGKESVKALVKSGTLKKWAMGVLRKYGNEMGQEMVTEALQELVSMLGQNHAASQANKEGATFAKHELADFAKAMGDVSVQTAKGMALLGLPSNVVGTLNDWRSGDARLIRDADRYSSRSSDSSILSTKNMILPKGTQKHTTNKPQGPIKVLDIAGQYRVLDAQETSYVQSALAKGAKGLHVQVVNTEGIQNDTSVTLARNIASALDAKHSGSAVVFPTNEQAKKAARQYALSSDAIVGFTENQDGSIEVSRKASDTEAHAITFTDESKIADAKPVEVQKSDGPKTSSAGSAHIKQKVRESVNRYEGALDSMGVSQSDREFLKANVIEKVAKVYRTVHPKAPLDEAYDSAIAASFFTTLSARVAKMDVQSYLEKHFTSDAFVPMSAEFETSHKKSAQFQILVDLAMNNRGISDTAQRRQFRKNAVPAAVIQSDRDGRNTVHLSRASTPMTIVHELGHALVDAIKDTEAFTPFQQLYADELASDGGQVGTAFQERFASDLELYIKEGSVRDERLRSVFERITEAIKEMLKYLNRSLDTDTRRAFDDLFDLGLRQEKEGAHLSAKGMQKITKALDSSQDTDTIATQLASIVEDELGFEDMPNLVTDYYLAEKLEGVERRNAFRKQHNIKQFQLWMMRLKLAEDRKLPRGPIGIRLEAIKHILTDHYLDMVSSEHVNDMVRMLGDPVAVLRCDSTVDKHFGWPLVVTDVMVDGYGGKQPLVIPLRPDRGGSSPMIHTMYPWDPRRQNNRSISEAMHSDLLLAINPNKKEAVRYAGSDLTADVMQLASKENVLDLTPYVNSTSTDAETQHASIEFLDTEDMQRALENHEYPSDADLAMFAGNEWADREIQFRRIITQDTQLVETFTEAYGQLQKELESADIADENARLIEILHEMVPEDERFDLEEETGDVARFIERMKWQVSYTGAREADRHFIRSLSDDTVVMDIAKRLTEDLDIAEDTEISPYLFRLAAKGDKPTGYAIRMARKEMRDDARYYRRLLLESEGNTQQLSYEMATEDTVLDTGEDAVRTDNSEVRKLLSGDTDPVIKSLIRKNLATSETLQALVDAMDEQAHALASQLDERNLTIEHLIEMVEQGEAEYAERNRGYLKLQKINSDNYERMRKYRRLLDTMIKRRDALATKVALERTERQIKRIAHPSANADVSLMDTLGKFLTIMRSDVSPSTDLSDSFKQTGLSFDMLPEQLKPFFVQRDDGIFFATKMNKMSIGQLDFLKRQMASVRSDAKAIHEQRKEQRKQRITPTATGYLASAHGIQTDEFTVYRQRVKDLKAEASPKGTHDAVKQGQKHKFKSLVDTMFLTPSRLIRTIDDSGTLFKWFFGEGGVDSITANEYRMTQQRYDVGSAKMKELGLTDKHLYKDHIEVRGVKHSLDEAIGVYVYSQQKAALDKLLSPDGNRYTQEDIDTIVSSLSDEHKAWGDFLIQEMTSRHGALSEVYRKVSNKKLSQVAKYFPLVRSGKDATMTDMLEEEYFNRQENPQDGMLKERTGGQYSLALNATTIWNRMVRKQEHYISAAEWVNDTQYLLRKNGGDLYDSIALAKGSKYAEALQDFVDRFANNHTIQDNTDNLVNTIRNNLIVARLAFNFTTALKQIPSLSYFLREFGPVRLVESLGHVLFHHKETTDFIYRMAPQLRNRNLSTDFAAVADMEGKNAYQRAVKQIGKAGMWPIRFMDSLVVSTLWYGAYNSKVAGGMDSAQAALEATRFIGDTQPGGNVVDSAAIYASHNAIVKYLLMFTNQLNKNFNLIYSDIPNALKHKRYMNALANFVGLGLGFAGIILISGGFVQDVDDDEEYFNQVLKQFGAQFVNQLPLFGSEFSNMVLEQYYGDNSLLLISETRNLLKSLSSDDSSRAEKSIVNFASGGLELAGLPSRAFFEFF